MTRPATPRRTNDVESPHEEIEIEITAYDMTSVQKGLPLEHALSSNGFSVDDTVDSQSQPDKEEPPNPTTKRRCWIIAGALLLVVVGFVTLGLGLGLGLSRNEVEVGGTTESPTTSADTQTDAPSSAPHNSTTTTTTVTDAPSLTPQNSTTTTTVMETFDKCTIETVLNQDGYNACQQQCEEASCCGAQVCNDTFTCLNYTRCELLTKAGGSVPRAPYNLQELCNIDAMREDVLESCMNACEPAACCDAQGADNCFHQGNALVCAEYDICKPIYALSSGGLGDPPENLTAVCNADTLSNVDGYRQCWIICQPARCCNDLGSDNCLLENIMTCGKWNIGGCYLLE